MTTHLDYVTGRFVLSEHLVPAGNQQFYHIYDGDFILGKTLVPGLGQNLFLDASLDLDFTRSLSLVDSVSGNNLVTFTRASSGTYVDSDGLIKATPVNLVSYSQDFTNPFWRNVLSSSTVSSPDGVQNAYELTNSNLLFQDSIDSAPANTTITASIFAKYNGTGNAEGIQLRVAGIGSRAPWVNFDLANGSTGNTSVASDTTSASSTWTLTGYGIEPFANGWYKVYITYTCSSSARIQFRPSGSPATDVENCSGTGIVLVFGAQVEEGTTATDYIPTGATISGAPRFDHDPVTRESLGLLIEEERTNLISLSNQANALQVVGPTTSSDTTEESSPTGSGTVVKLDKSGSGQGFARFNYTAVTYSQTFSVFVKKGTARYVGLRMLSSPSTHTTFDLENNNWVVTTGSTSRGYQQYENGWVRLWIVNDNTDSKAWASVAMVNSGGAESNTESGTFYAFGFQRERGSFPTSYIPTTGSTVTRAADTAIIEGTNFSSWYNQSEGTVFIKVLDAAYGQADCYELSNGSLNNRRNVRIDANASKISRTIASAAAISQQTSATNYTGYPVSFKAAATDNFKFFVDGVSGSDGNTNALPTNMTQLSLGFRESQNNNYLNGHISRLAYFPVRKTDEELQELTE